MTLPDFDHLAELLAQAPPLELAILPERAFVLVAQLQLALRHPDNNGSAAEIARDIAQRLQARLGEIDPAISLALEQGWHPEFDVSREAFNTLVQEQESHPAADQEDFYDGSDG